MIYQKERVYSNVDSFALSLRITAIHSPLPKSNRMQQISLKKFLKFLYNLFTPHPTYPSASKEPLAW